MFYDADSVSNQWCKYTTNFWFWQEKYKSLIGHFRCILHNTDNLKRQLDTNLQCTNNLREIFFNSTHLIAEHFV